MNEDIGMAFSVQKTIPDSPQDSPLIQIETGPHVRLFTLEGAGKYMASLERQLNAGYGAVIVYHAEDDYRNHITLPPDGAKRLIAAIQYEMWPH